MLTTELPSQPASDDSDPADSESASRLGSPVVGTWCLALTLALLALAMQWLKGDTRFRASASLSAAARLVLTESAVAVTPEQVFFGAADGLVSVLDPYSSYLSPDDYGLFKEEAEGEYVGIGIELRVTDGVATITEVYPQSPAADALLRPGDRIVSINGTLTHALDFSAIQDSLHGETGEAVTLQIERSGVPARTVRLVRRAVAIEAFPIAGVSRSGLGYIRWMHFSVGSADRLAAIIEDLVIDDPTGIILDLRGNPGGVLDEAITAAGFFLPANTRVCTLIDAQGIRMPYHTESHLPPDFHGPLVIVQDETSASSAEVLIAALHDGGRAVTVGRRSFGKGWVQSIFPLDTLGAIRLSVARYETPAGALLGDPAESRAQYDSILAGKPWTGTGLDPDEIVEPSRDDSWQNAVPDLALLSEFVTDYADDWPAVGADDSDMLFDELQRWLGERHQPPPPLLGDSLLAGIRNDAPTSPDPKRWIACAKLLEAAMSKELSLLMKREQPQLLLYLWEKRLQYVGQPDPGELEALLDLDPDLSAARDLIEQPERYELLLKTAATSHEHAAARP